MKKEEKMSLSDELAMIAKDVSYFTHPGIPFRIMQAADDVSRLERELEIARALQPPPPEPPMQLGSAASTEGLTANVPHDVDHYYKECFGHWDGIHMCSCDEQQKTDCQREAITRAEACRIAREVTEDAECRRAETAEREAKTFHEQSPREIIEQFLDYANLRGWNIRNFYGVCIKIDDLADLIEEFENEKEKQ